MEKQYHRRLTGKRKVYFKNEMTLKVACALVFMIFLWLCILTTFYYYGDTTSSSLRNSSRHKIDNNIENTASFEIENTASLENEQHFPTSAEWLEAGTAAGTDKVLHHYYHLIYPKHVNAALQEYRPLSAGKKPLIVELGGWKFASAAMWCKLYPWTQLVVVDIRMMTGDEFRGARFIQADLSKEAGLLKFLKIMNATAPHDRPSVIVDDASHLPEHQLIAVRNLFEYLLPGGVYIIEDIETSQWRKGEPLYDYTTTGDTSILDSVRDLAQWPMAEFSSKGELQRGIDFMGSEKNARDVGEVAIGYNCLIIRKKTEEERILSNREYKNRKALKSYVAAS